MPDDSENAAAKLLVDSALAVHAESNLIRACELIESEPDKHIAARAYQLMVKRLYFERRSLPAMLLAGASAVKFCISEAGRFEAAHDAGNARKLGIAAKTIAYNTAANAWPGWNDEGIAPAPGGSSAGLEMARLSLRLVQKLDLGPEQLGNGLWLIGAHELAFGQTAKAVETFALAGAEFAKAGNRAGERMAEGYAALTAHLAQPADAERLARYEETLRALREEGSEDAPAYASQIETARVVFEASGAFGGSPPAGNGR